MNEKQREKRLDRVSETPTAQANATCEPGHISSSQNACYSLNGSMFVVGAEGEMSALVQAVITLCVLAIVAGSATAEQIRNAQKVPSARAAGRATIYFLCPDGLIAPGSPGVEVDGRKVGELRAGTYFIVKVSSGPHTLKILPMFLAGSWESDVEFSARRTYFIELGTIQTGAIGARALTAALAGTTGRQMAGRGFTAGHCFYALEADEGRAKIATLRRVSSR